MEKKQLWVQYIKQNWRAYVMGMGCCGIFLICFALYHLPIEALAYPAFLSAAAVAIFTIFDFQRVKRRHEELKCIRSLSDVIAGDLPKAEEIEQEDYQELLRLIGEEHKVSQERMNRRYADMVDYYTVWAHQIKTPIASMRLHLQNEDSALSRKLYAELHRIEQYVEMVLTFLRLDSESSDYVIRKCDLDSVIRQAVKKFSHEFIGRKLSLSYEPVNAVVITDEKWLSFVVEQVLSNALKYTQSGGITISMEAEKKLTIRDTGIGIAPEDLPRIFENGFTGYNGRSDKKASGIGLYLCKRICSNLGHTIWAESVVDKGTVITIDLTQKPLEVE